MKVKDLIEELKKQDPEADVYMTVEVHTLQMDEIREVNSVGDCHKSYYNTEEDIVILS